MKLTGWAANDLTDGGFWKANSKVTITGWKSDWKNIPMERCRARAARRDTDGEVNSGILYGSHSIGREEKFGYYIYGAMYKRGL